MIVSYPQLIKSGGVKPGGISDVPNIPPPLSNDHLCPVTTPRTVGQFSTV